VVVVVVVVGLRYAVAGGCPTGTKAAAVDDART
jgi:hypothetical protein